MIKQAIDKIQEMTKATLPKIIDVHGLSYDKQNNIYVCPPMPEPITTNTLTGLVGWLDTPEAKSICNDRPDNKNGIHGNKLFITINSHLHCQILTPSDEYENRKCYIQAKHSQANFNFNHYMDQEDFIINVQTMFVDTPEKAALIAMVSGIQGNDVKTCTDDGISQTVSVKNSVGRLEDTDTNPIVELHPRRTFSEVTQPPSPFLVRIKKGSDKPQVALFEADSGSWKVDAINNIKGFLRSALKEKEFKLKVIG